MSKRNVGEIIKRGRIYYIRYYDGKGRRRLETTKSTDRNVAERELRKRLTAKDAGVSPDAAIGKLTLKEATDDLQNDYKMNGRRSLPEVKRKIELHLLPYFGERRRMTSITTADMRAFITERQREEKDDDGTITKRTAKNAEINRELAALRRAFRLALRAGRLVQIPYIPMLRENNVRKGFLEQDQIDRICLALPESLRPVVKFTFATGWRARSEVLSLEWRSVDWVGRCVRLDPGTTKNGEGRFFPFTADIETVLKDQLAVHEALKKAGRVVPFVFHRDGNRIKEFRTAWKNACKAAGCPGKLIHDMRRSAVRAFERHSVPRSVAMNWIGHKTESIYRRYAIVDEAMHREAAARLDAWIAAPAAATATVTPLRRGNRRRGRVTG